MSRVRLALVGCGGMSRSHLRRFHVLSDRLELAAAVDVDPEKAAAVAEMMPGVRTASDYREILDDVDAVLLVLPHH